MMICLGELSMEAGEVQVGGASQANQRVLRQNLVKDVVDGDKQGGDVA